MQQFYSEELYMSKEYVHIFIHTPEDKYSNDHNDCLCKSQKLEAIQFLMAIQ